VTTPLIAPLAVGGGLNQPILLLSPVANHIMGGGLGGATTPPACLTPLLTPQVDPMGAATMITTTPDAHGTGGPHQGGPVSVTTPMTTLRGGGGAPNNNSNTTTVSGVGGGATSAAIPGSPAPFNATPFSLHSAEFVPQQNLPINPQQQQQQQQQQVMGIIPQQPSAANAGMMPMSAATPLAQSQPQQPRLSLPQFQQQQQSGQIQQQSGQLPQSGQPQLRQQIQVMNTPYNVVLSPSRGPAAHPAAADASAVSSPAQAAASPSPSPRQVGLPLAASPVLLAQCDGQGNPSGQTGQQPGQLSTQPQSSPQQQPSGSHQQQQQQAHAQLPTPQQSPTAPLQTQPQQNLQFGVSGHQVQQPQPQVAQFQHQLQAQQQQQFQQQLQAQQHFQFVGQQQSQQQHSNPMSATAAVHNHVSQNVYSLVPTPQFHSIGGAGGLQPATHQQLQCGGPQNVNPATQFVNPGLGVAMNPHGGVNNSAMFSTPAASASVNNGYSGLFFCCE